MPRDARQFKPPAMTTDEDHVPQTPQEKSLPLAAAIGTRRLIAAIILMPVIAVIATAAIILYAKARPTPAPAKSAAETLQLPPDGRIVETTLDGRRLVIRIDAPDGGEIAVFDLVTGERIQTIKIERR